MRETRLPPDVDARLFIEPTEAGKPRFVVLLSCPPEEPTPASFADLLTTPGTAAAYVALEHGVCWPDRGAEALVHRTLGRGGVAWLGFANLWDAVDCKARVDEVRT